MVKINKYIERAQLKCETHTQTPKYMHIHHMDGKRERKKSTNATRAEKTAENATTPNLFKSYINKLI